MKLLFRTLSITLKLFKKSIVFGFWKVGTNPSFGFWGSGKLVGCTQPFKNKERMDLYSPPNPPKTKKEWAWTQPTFPPTLFFKKKTKRGLVHNPLPLPKNKRIIMKTWEKISFCTNLISFFVPYYSFNYTFRSLFWISSPIWPKLVILIPT